MFRPFGATAQTPPQRGDLTMPITGGGCCLTFSGTFSLQKFVATSRGVSAVGALTGTMTNSDGGVVIVVRKIMLPVTIGDVTQEIVRLDLGPLSLDLLGLRVTLSPIALDIVPEPRPIVSSN